MRIQDRKYPYKSLTVSVTYILLGEPEELIKHGLRALRETLPSEQELTTKVLNLLKGHVPQSLAYLQFTSASKVPKTKQSFTVNGTHFLGGKDSKIS